MSSDNTIPDLLSGMLKHGGRLNQAVRQYGIPKEQWLDLSTGINPNGWPVPEVPQEIYNRLPENDDGLLQAAQTYYRVSSLLPVAGSQEAIQLLPELLQRYHLIPDNPTIGIISPCYAEHEYQWRKQRCTIVQLTSETVNKHLESLNVLLIVNPNNPTGELLDPETILHWQRQLAQQHGFIIIDEAFMDSTPQHSVLMQINHDQTGYDNLIVLRSIGKFFGLAGVRCGFVIAAAKILNLLQYHQGPWPLSNPTRWIVKKALTDRNWTEKNNLFLHKESGQLQEILQKYYCINNSKLISGTHLFKTLWLDNAPGMYQELAQNGVLVRLLDNHQGLRFGLPANKQQWRHLKSVLAKIVAHK